MANSPNLYDADSATGDPGGMTTSRDGAANQFPVTASPDRESKHCPICGEMIWKFARKCTHCGTDFTWRRYLVFGNTTLALLTALISVVAASLPALRMVSVPDNSVITSHFAGIPPNGDVVNILINNSGRKAGVVDRLSIGIDYGNDRHFNIYPQPTNDQALLIQPGVAVLATFSFDGAHAYWQPDAAKEDLPSLGGDEARPLLEGATCRYWLRITNADGNRPPNPATAFSCQDSAFQMFRRMLYIKSATKPAAYPASLGNDKK